MAVMKAVITSIRISLEDRIQDLATTVMTAMVDMKIKILVDTTIKVLEGTTVKVLVDTLTNIALEALDKEFSVDMQDLVDMQHLVDKEDMVQLELSAVMEMLVDTEDLEEMMDIPGMILEVILDLVVADMDIPISGQVGQKAITVDKKVETMDMMAMDKVNKIKAMIMGLATVTLASTVKMKGMDMNSRTTMGQITEIMPVGKGTKVIRNTRDKPITPRKT